MCNQSIEQHLVPFQLSSNYIDNVNHDTRPTRPNGKLTVRAENGPWVTKSFATHDIDEHIYGYGLCHPQQQFFCQVA